MHNLTYPPGSSHSSHSPLRISQHSSVLSHPSPTSLETCSPDNQTTPQRYRDVRFAVVVMGLGPERFLRQVKAVWHRKRRVPTASRRPGQARSGGRDRRVSYTRLAPLLSVCQFHFGRFLLLAPHEHDGDDDTAGGRAVMKAQVRSLPAVTFPTTPPRA